MKHYGSFIRALASIILLGALMAIPAYANEIQTWSGFPPDPIQQQDKIWGGFSGTLPAGFNTTITTFTSPAGDLHAISFDDNGGNGFASGQTYTVTFYIEIAPGNPTLSIHRAGVGIDDSSSSGSIKADLTNLSITLGPTNGNTGLVVIPNSQLIWVTDTLVAGNATVSFSNSFDQTAIPEPGTLALLGTGLVGLAGAIRRKLVQ